MGEKFVFVLLQPLVHKHHSKLIVCDGRISFALSFRHHLLSREFGGLPLAELNSVLDHLPLAGKAMPAVLLVRFLEAFESPFFPVLV